MPDKNDPAIDRGVRIHMDIMMELSKYIRTEKELARIGRMIDILVGSVVVDTVRITRTDQDRAHVIRQYTDAIRQKLRQHDGLEGA